MTPDTAAAAHVAVLELEAAAALAAAGFPTDLTRPPHPWELATSFAAIDEARARAEATVAAAAARARQAALAVLVARLAGSRDPYDVLARLDEVAAGMTSVPELTAIVDDTAATVTAALLSAAEAGLTTFADDAARAGLPPAADAPLTGAQAVAAAQGRRVAASAVDAAVRQLRDAAWSLPRSTAAAGVSADAAAFTAEAAAQARTGSTRALEDVARQAALAAYAEGRTTGIAAVPDVTGTRWYASELLDRNTCTPCSHVDGTAYPSRAAALADYPDGRYRDCEGGDRCRGTLVAVAADEVAPTLGRPGSSARRNSAAPAHATPARI